VGGFSEFGQGESLKTLIDFARFAVLCWEAWKMMRRKNLGYVHLVAPSGMPVMCIFAAQNREAWQASVLATSVLLARPNRESGRPLF
jgi:hypothetical protein